MKLFSKDHYDLMEAFEREYRGERLDREGKDYWPKKIIYQDARVNQLFLAYRSGYALGAAQATGEQANERD